MLVISGLPVVPTPGEAITGFDGEEGGTAEIENTPGSLSSKGFEDPPSKKVLNDTLAVILGFEYVGALPLTSIILGADADAVVTPEALASELVASE